VSVEWEHSRLQTPLADTRSKCAKVSAWWTGHGPYTSASHTQQPATVSISYTPSAAAALRRSDGGSGGEVDAAADARDDGGWEVSEGAEDAGGAAGGEGEVQRSERTLWARTFGRLRLFRARPQVCSS
jgi:hypothetical protein